VKKVGLRQFERWARGMIPHFTQDRGPIGLRSDLEHFRRLFNRALLPVILIGWGCLSYAIMQLASPRDTVQGASWWDVLRCFSTPVVLSAGLFTFFAWSLKENFRMPGWRPAFHYLELILFGAWYPGIVVRQGKVDADPDQYNLLTKVGGPGYVIVELGNAAVLESYQLAPLRRNACVRVVTNGVFRLCQFERIKQVVGLEDQKKDLDPVECVTKDGITVIVNSVRIRYRIVPGKTNQSLQTDPFPLDSEMVLRSVYGRQIGAAGPQDWHWIVQGMVKTALKKYFSRRLLNQVIAPNGGEDPRSEILRQIRSVEFSNELLEYGAEITWMDIGRFDLPKEAEEQRVDTWRTRWAGNAELTRSLGQAQNDAYREIGEAEGQAEMLLGIIQSLEDLGTNGDSGERLHDLFLVRIAQLIRGLSGGGKPEET
jgi:regulator of protease activity HflC (stomatin/prohibitin superfamily)